MMEQTEVRADATTPVQMAQANEPYLTSFQSTYCAKSSSKAALQVYTYDELDDNEATPFAFCDER